MKLRFRVLAFRVLAVGVSGLLAIAVSGCVVAAAAAAAGAVAYVKAELNATLGEDVADVARATDRAISELRFFELSNKKDAVSAEFIMRNAKDDRITITLTRTGPDLTKVEIRVGLLGDEELSRSILDAIKRHL